MVSTFGGAKTFYVVGALALTTVVACVPASIDGTPYKTGRSASTGARDKDKNKNNAPSPFIESAPGAEGGEPQGATSSAETRETPVSSASPSPSVIATTTAPPATTTTPPVPRAPQPDCGSPDDRQCFSCCLDANPGAVPVEDDFDQCLDQCVDQRCADACAQEHAVQCRADSACAGHHACLQASGCFGPDA